MVRGAKKSGEMLKARELIAGGMSAAEAARQTGLTPGALSQDPECKRLIEENREAKMREVHRHVRAGMTWRGACEHFGVTQSGYSRYLKRLEARQNEKVA